MKARAITPSRIRAPVLTVRDYDGPDDKYAITEPVVVTAPNEGFLSLVWGETTLTKK